MTKKKSEKDKDKLGPSMIKKLSHKQKDIKRISANEIEKEKSPEKSKPQVDKNLKVGKSIKKVLSSPRVDKVDEPKKI